MDGIRFKSPNIAGDILLLALMLPIAIFVLALPFAVPLLVAGVPPLSDATAWKIAGALSTLVVARLARQRIFFSVTLADEALLLGRWWPIRIPYERIRLITVGRQQQSLAFLKRDAGDPEPLTFSTGMFRARRIFLKREDARRCYHELYARCPNAGAIDADANILPPRNPDAAPFARIKLAENLATRWLLAFAVALACFAGIVGFLMNSEGRRRERPDRVGQVIAMLASGGFSAAGYGVHAFAKMRKVLRGEFDNVSTARKPTERVPD